jgi:uncharacterized protein YbaR (Trm112 family)
MDKELLELLVCPENQTPLHPAEPSLLEKLNQAIAVGTLVNRAGQPVKEPLQGGLVREDGAMLYPVVDDIPVMLLDEAIPLDQVR